MHRHTNRALKTKGKWKGELERCKGKLEETEKGFLTGKTGIQDLCTAEKR